ncbi:MAG TPA: tRNA pseudouridine(38-40) synthase TruA [Bacteroidota bacterium]|nr:tRNA pseudouridine(38-40) synthase TruA [Bacteroidota bacterium]
MQNVKLKLEYDGTDFAGWQFQENGRSVQGEVEKALRSILQEEIRVIGSGRTDAGVHARGQVAHFHTNKEIVEQTLANGLNGVLPRDVAVINAERVDEKFHARYNAKMRQYKYYISQRPTALMRNYCWWLSYKLDVDLMVECARLVVGEHDFSSFCKSEADVEHHRCTVFSASWTAHDSVLEFDISANRFLHGMVRALVGTMVDIGRGYKRLDQYREILAAKNRSAAGIAVPAQGLFLEKVVY